MRRHSATAEPQSIPSSIRVTLLLTRLRPLCRVGPADYQAGYYCLCIIVVLFKECCMHPSLSHACEPPSGSEHLLALTRPSLPTRRHISIQTPHTRRT